MSDEFELTVAQESARKSLQRALNKCYNAQLGLRVLDGNVYVVTPDYLPCDEVGNEIDEASGYFDVTTKMTNIDGAAGN